MSNLLKPSLKPGSLYLSDTFQETYSVLNIWVMQLSEQLCYSHFLFSRNWHISCLGPFVNHIITFSMPRWSKSLSTWGSAIQTLMPAEFTTTELFLAPKNQPHLRYLLLLLKKGKNYKISVLVKISVMQGLGELLLKCLSNSRHPTSQADPQCMLCHKLFL